MLTLFFYNVTVKSRAVEKKENLAPSIEGDKKNREVKNAGWYRI